MNTITKRVLLILFTISYIVGVVMYVLTAGFQNLQSIVIITISIGLLVFVYRQLKRIRHGEVMEDELSFRVRDKAAARSFYISIYLWLVLSYVYEIPGIAQVIGMSGMAVLFAVNYFIASRGNNIDY